MTEAEAMDTVDQAREEALAEYRTKLLAHKEVDSQVSEARPFSRSRRLPARKIKKRG